MSGLDDVLAASLESAFEPSPDITKSTVSISSQPSTSSSAVILDASASANEASASAEPATSGDGALDSEAWKDDYEKYLQHWQAESAVARQKAEETREIWEKRRAEEKKAGKERNDDWETYVTPSTTPPPEKEPIHHRSTTCAADGRDFVPGAEAEKGSGKETIESMLPSIEQPNPPYPSSLNAQPRAKGSSPGSDREKSEWTQINPRSVESSFPDISFPSRPSSPHQHQSHSVSKDTDSKANLPHPPSATLTIFDGTLSTRTRILALSSALAINFLLPFVNGVMLGFGEIFARNIVAWIGWSPSRGARNTATAIGIGAVGARRREDMARKEL